MRFVRGISKLNDHLKFSELTAKECFLLSRMVVVDEGAHQNRHQQLSFEDFLEATVRLTELMEVKVEVEDGEVEQEWDSNNPDIVAPVLDELVESILSKYDRDGDGGVTRAEVLHENLHRRNTRFSL